jgi:hypothetical protein
MINSKCDVCSKAVKYTPTVAHKIDTDGLIVLCKECWKAKGLWRDRYNGQIQDGYYLAV